MDTLQLAVAGDPLQPCCWLWPYFRPAQLSTVYMAVVAALDACCQVPKWILCNLQLQDIHWKVDPTIVSFSAIAKQLFKQLSAMLLALSLAAGSGHFIFLEWILQVSLPLKFSIWGGDIFQPGRWYIAMGFKPSKSVIFCFDMMKKKSFSFWNLFSLPSFSFFLFLLLNFC